MVTKTYRGAADWVKKVVRFTLHNYSTAITHTFTCNDVAISIQPEGGSPDALSEIMAFLNSQTHPYFQAYTWAADPDNTAAILGTALQPGLDHDWVLTDDGALGSPGASALAEVTAPTGPNDLANTANYSPVGLPTDGDTLIVPGTGANITLNLTALTAINLNELHFLHGKRKVGLPPDKTTTNGAGTSFNTAAPEYRELYMQVGFAKLFIGKFEGANDPGGTERMNVQNTLSGSPSSAEYVVYNCGETGEDGHNAINLLSSDYGSTLEILGGKGGVGIGALKQDTYAQIGEVCLVGASSKVALGDYCDWKDVVVQGGTASINFGTNSVGIDPNSVTVHAGTATIVGANYKIATLTVNGGHVIDKHTDATASAVGAVTLNGGILDASQTEAARTWDSIALNSGTFKKNAKLTVTTTTPPTGRQQIAVTDLPS